MVVIATTVAGCGPPQVATEHRELVLRLATATSTEDLGILNRAAAEVEQLEISGGLRGREAQAFHAIISKARNGDWEASKQLAYKLRDVQRPTKVDQARVAKRTLRAPKTLNQSGTGLVTGSPLPGP